MHQLNQTEVTSCVKGVLAFRYDSTSGINLRHNPSALRQQTVEELADMVKGSWLELHHGFP